MQWIKLALGVFLTLDGLICICGIANLTRCRRQRMEPAPDAVAITAWAALLLLVGVILICLVELQFWNWRFW